MTLPQIKAESYVGGFAVGKPGLRDTVGGIGTGHVDPDRAKVIVFLDANQPVSGDRSHLLAWTSVPVTWTL